MAKTNEKGQSQKGKQKFIQFSDIVIIFVFCLGLLLFIVMTWQKVGDIASPENFTNRVSKLIDDLEGDEVAPPVLSDVAAETEDKFASSITSEPATISGIYTHILPGIIIRIPLPGEETSPVTGLEVVQKGSSEGNIVIKWVAAKNENCHSYKVRWWRMSSFKNEEYKDIEIRNQKEIDPNKMEGEKFVEARYTTTTIENVTPNEDYIIDVISMTIDKEQCTYQEAIENAYIANVVSPGEEKEMPQPQNFRVEQATLAGIELRWDAFNRIYNPEVHPKSATVKVAIYRWKEGKEDEKVLLNPADDQNPFGTMVNRYQDLSIEPDVPYYYAIQYYHIESYPHPEWTNKEVNYLYDEIIKVKIQDVDPKNRNGKFKDNKIVWIERDVYASKLYVLPEPIVLKDRPVVEVRTIQGNTNPDHPQSNAKLYLTVYKSLPVPENPSESKFVRVKVELDVKVGDVLKGTTARPEEIDGQKFDRTSKYWQLLRDKNISIDFETSLKVVGIYNIEYKYSKGSTDKISYIELKNMDIEYKDCWPFKVYRANDIKEAQEIRDKEESGELKLNDGLRKRALIPNNPGDKQRGLNPEERKEMLDKIMQFAKQHNQNPSTLKDKTYKFTKEFEDYLWEFLIENEIRFYTNDFLKEFPILRDYDQLRKLN